MITPARTTPDDPRSLHIGEYREGALQRFLEDRD
jgi:hypothetical protein